MPTLDNTDREIIAKRARLLDEETGVRVGDYVEFADGVTRRISQNWGDSVQTSDGGSWYLGGPRDDGSAYVSFSGSLYRSVRVFTEAGEPALIDTGERRDGSVWIFHHDQHQAHNGVHSTIPFRVYRCDLPAPA